ncbi:ABC transporter A family member 6-like [Arachis ipaensis]|uniref:ABC transporter A family member 6-like n=1 Tax=Arachis ipaensis TaxID=130454 RepID=UPI000A2B0A7C|nr:ABC transporter A family member 6-like [Arachis ipaensis]
MIPDVKVNCTQAFTLWRNSFSDIWDELQLEDRDDDTTDYKLHKNPISGAFDFLNSNKNIFNVSFLIYKRDNRDQINMSRTPRSVNMVCV